MKRDFLKLFGLFVSKNYLLSAAVDVKYLKIVSEKLQHNLRTDEIKKLFKTF